MEYKIKKKLVNGQIKYGMINEELEVLLPFEYENIEERYFETENDLNPYFETEIDLKPYYIIYDENGKKGIFIDGKLLTEPKYDFIAPLPKTNRYNSRQRFLVGRKTETEMGYAIFEQTYKNDNTCTFDMVYPFGKADKIEYEDGKIILYKKKGDKLLKGVFDDHDLGTQDPKFTELDLYKYSPSKRPNMPDPKRVFGDENTNWSLYLCDKGEITFAKIGKVKNKQDKKGIIIKTVAKQDDNYAHEYKWNVLVPFDYSDCNINTDENLIFLEQSTEGKKLKGLMGYTTNFDVYTKGAAVYGNCTFKPEFTIPCEYDEITLLYDASEEYKKYKEQFYITKKGDKFGLLKVVFGTVRGPYDNYRENPEAKVEILLECEYDKIEVLPENAHEGYKINFVFTKDNKKGLLIDIKSAKNHNLPLMTECKYKNIDFISNGKSDDTQYIIENFKNKKSIFEMKYGDQAGYCEWYGKFQNTPFLYNEINDVSPINRYRHYDPLFSCYKKMTGLYDIYDNSTRLKISDVNSISVKSDLYKIIKNIDEDISKIIFWNLNGELLLEESGKNISAKYSEALKMFIISRDGSLQIKKSLQDNPSNDEFDIQGEYKIFDMIDRTDLIKYQKQSTDKNPKFGMYKIQVDRHNKKIIPILDDIYEGIDTVVNDSRSIVSKLDEETKKIKYGVVENKKGNACIPIEFDTINIEKDELLDEETFVAIKNMENEIEKYKFDLDGFLIDKETIKKEESSKVLKK